VFVLTVEKAAVRFCSDMKYHTKHYSLLVVISFVFPPHKLCFRTHIYKYRSIVKSYLASYCTRVKASMYSLVYWHILIT
jgi:hypothetical protein